MDMKPSLARENRQDLTCPAIRSLFGQKRRAFDFFHFGGIGVAICTQFRLQNRQIFFQFAQILQLVDSDVLDKGNEETILLNMYIRSDGAH